jgi:hypothetical protein
VALPSHADLMKAALKAHPAPASPAPPATSDELSVRPPVCGMPVEPFAQAPATLELLPESDQALEDPWFSAAQEGADASKDVGITTAADESPQPPSGPRPVTPPPSFVLGSLSPIPGVTAPQQAKKELTPTPSSVPPPPGLKPMLTLGSLHPPEVVEETPKPKKKAKVETPKPGKAEKTEATSRASSTPRPGDATPRFPLPSAYLPRASSEAPKKDRKTLYWVAFALVGVAFAVWARWSREKVADGETAMMQSVQDGRTTPAPADTSVESTAPQQEAQADNQSQVEPATDEATLPEELPLRESDKLKKGQGLLEIVAGKSDTVYIDGKPVGSGPTVSLPLKARKYEVRVKTRGDERTRFVEVKENKLVRVRIAPPWQR